MEINYRNNFVAQACRLPDHVHAFPHLRRRIDVNDGVAFAVLALRGDTQAPQIEVFKPVADLVARSAAFQEIAAHLVEFMRKRRDCAACRVSRAGFQRNRALAGERLLLKLRHDRASFDDLARDEIGASHQDADADAAFDERRRKNGDHGGGHSVANAAGEKHMKLMRLVRRNLFEKRMDLGFPEDETRQRPDVAAAFAPLEHEASPALFYEHAQEFRARHMDIGGDAFLLEGSGLVGAAAGDERHWRLEFQHGLDLLVAQLLRYEAEETDAPGARSAQHPRFFEQLRRLFAGHQGQRQEGKPAGRAHGVCEFRRVRHARHRPLKDRKPQAMGLCEQGTLRERALGVRDCVTLWPLVQDRADEPARGLVFVSEMGCEFEPLTNGPGVRFGRTPSDQGFCLLAPFFGRPLVSFGALA